jgi:hypothetical protein
VIYNYLISNKHFLKSIIKGGDGTHLKHTVPEVKPLSSERKEKRKCGCKSIVTFNKNKESNHEIPIHRDIRRCDGGTFVRAD